MDQIHVEDVTAEDLAVEDVLPRHARRRAKAAGNAVAAMRMASKVGRTGSRATSMGSYSSRAGSAKLDGEPGAEMARVPTPPKDPPGTAPGDPPTPRNNRARRRWGNAKNVMKAVDIIKTPKEEEKDVQDAWAEEEEQQSKCTVARVAPWAGMLILCGAAASVVLSTLSQGMEGCLGALDDGEERPYLLARLPRPGSGLGGADLANYDWARWDAHNAFGPSLRTELNFSIWRLNFSVSSGIFTKI